MLAKLSTAFLLLTATLLVGGLLARYPVTSNRVKAAQKESQLFGDWTGESICQVKNSPCHDEKVVYHLSRGSETNVVNISADKIVDGKAVNMGQAEYKYDKDAGTLVNHDHGSWKLTIKGNRIEGTLMLPDGTLYRKLALTKNGE